MGVELTRGLTGELDLDNKGEDKSTQYSVSNNILDRGTTTIMGIHTWLVLLEWEFKTHRSFSAISFGKKCDI